MDNYQQGLAFDDDSFQMIQQVMQEDFGCTDPPPPKSLFRDRGCQEDIELSRPSQQWLQLDKGEGGRSGPEGKLFLSANTCLDNGGESMYGESNECSFPMVDEVKDIADPPIPVTVVRLNRSRRKEQEARAQEMEEVARLEEVKRIKARFDQTVHQLYLSNKHKWLKQKEAIRIAHLHEQAVTNHYCEALNIDPSTLEVATESGSARFYRSREQRVEAQLCAMAASYMNKSKDIESEQEDVRVGYKQLAEEALEVTKPYRKALRGTFETFSRVERAQDTSFSESASHDQEMSLQEFNLLLRAFNLGSVLAQPKSVSKHVHARMTYGDFLAAMLALAQAHSRNGNGNGSKQQTSPIARWRQFLEHLSETAHNSTRLSSKHWPKERFVRQLRRYKVAAFALQLIDEILQVALDVNLMLSASDTTQQLSSLPLPSAMAKPNPSVKQKIKSDPAPLQPSKFSLWLRKIKAVATARHGPLDGNSIDACARVLWRITQPQALAPERLAECLERQVVRYQEMARTRNLNAAMEESVAQDLQRKRLKKIKKLYDSEREQRMQQSATLRAELEKQLAVRKAAKLAAINQKAAMQRKRQEKLKQQVFQHVKEKKRAAEEERLRDDAERARKRRENAKQIAQRTEMLKRQPPVPMKTALKTLKSRTKTKTRTKASCQRKPDSHRLKPLPKPTAPAAKDDQPQSTLKNTRKADRLNDETIAFKRLLKACKSQADTKEVTQSALLRCAVSNPSIFAEMRAVYPAGWAKLLTPASFHATFESVTGGPKRAMDEAAFVKLCGKHG